MGVGAVPHGLGARGFGRVNWLLLVVDMGGGCHVHQPRLKNELLAHGLGKMGKRGELACWTPEPMPITPANTIGEERSRKEHAPRLQIIEQKERPRTR